MQVSSQLTTQEMKKIRQYSIERMINNTIKILTEISTDPFPKASHISENVTINLDDWTDLKTVVVKMWNEYSSQAFLELQKIQQEPKPGTTK